MYRQHEHISPSIPANESRSKITLLTRDPGCLFAFWEISEEQISAFEKKYGKQLWEKSIPALRITNLTKNESFHIRINNFSDSWYINITAPNSMYTADIGRMLPDSLFISLACSNNVSVPTNDISPNSKACFINVNNMTPEYSMSDTFTAGTGSVANIIRQPISLINKHYAEIHEKSMSEYTFTSSESFLKG